MGATLAATPYRRPELFDGLNTLDLIELCGSMAAAAGPLNLSQPTVSRRYQKISRDFGLNKASRRFLENLHYGETTCIRLLRRAFQSHRLDSSVLRIGSDPLRQGLMDGVRNVLPVPAQFRHARFLHRLVESSILDGALLSSLEIDGLLPGRPQGPDPLGLGEPASGSVAAPPVATPQVDESIVYRKAAKEWHGCLLVPLGCWQLGLVAAPDVDELPPRWSEVLVPPLAWAPGLASAVRQQQWMVRQAPQAFYGSRSQQGLASQQLPCIATASWFAALSCPPRGLRWLELPTPIREQIWLLVNPSTWEQYPTLAELAETIKASIASFMRKTHTGIPKKGGQLVC